MLIFKPSNIIPPLQSLCVFVLLGLTIASCQDTGELGKIEREEIKNEVKGVIDSLIYPLGNGHRFDFNELRSKYLDSNSIYWAGNPGPDIDHPGPTLTPEEHLNMFWPEIEKMSENNDAFDIEQYYAVIYRDRVLAILSAEIAENPGDPPSGKSWAGSFVWTISDNDWKLIHFQVSLSRAYSIVR